MTLEEMEQAREKAQRPVFRATVKDELEHMNWRLVIAIAFGFLMWYAGSAVLERLFK